MIDVGIPEYHFRKDQHGIAHILRRVGRELPVCEWYGGYSRFVFHENGSVTSHPTCLRCIARFQP